MVESESNETVNLDWAIQYLKNKCIEEQDYLNQTKHFFDEEYKSASIKKVEEVRERRELAEERIKMLNRSISILKYSN
jgi:methylthioribose-1-phosphate isomerase